MTVLEFNNKFINIEDNLERFALSLTFNEEEAKELMQETYLKALTYKDKIVEFGNIKAWMFTIMKNTFINSYRKTGSVDNKKDFLLLNNLQESQLIGTDSEITYKKINSVINALKNELKIPLRMLTEGYQYNETA
jgi:DNA-directed RNA polymerase specialized sigma24 family protein